MTADQLLDKLAREGGVIVSSGVMTASGIAQAQACGRFYVNQDHLGFAHLPNCIAHPKDLPVHGACGGND